MSLLRLRVAALRQMPVVQPPAMVMSTGCTLALGGLALHPSPARSRMPLRTTGGPLQRGQQTVITQTGTGTHPCTGGAPQAVLYYCQKQAAYLVRTQAAGSIRVLPVRTRNTTPTGTSYGPSKNWDEDNRLAQRHHHVAHGGDAAGRDGRSRGCGLCDRNNHRSGRRDQDADGLAAGPTFRSPDETRLSEAAPRQGEP